MQLIKPYIVNHDGSPIYSISVDPSGSKFVTSGLSETSTGLIMIWDMQAVLIESPENEQRPLLLCRMEAHSACINCVRWSGRPKVFATAGSDSLVMVWTFAGYCPSSSGFKVPPEYWKCTATMAGHTADVLGIDWSPGDRYLASCSVDNSIIVWNANKLPEKVATLRGHDGLVKGLRFDPIGKYLASQADDKTLRIWATSDWTLLETIRKPFEKTAGSTHMLRLDWSPDGLFLASAHAMNNGGPVSKIIERNEWTFERDFVGHRKAVTCVRWSPTFYRAHEENSQPMISCVCAVGSKDKTLSVWSMSRSRPIAVLSNVFAETIMDMVWCADGAVLFLSSLDGNVAFCKFSPEDTGVVLPQPEKIDYLKRVYGNIEFSHLGFLDSDYHCATGGPSRIIENPQFLAAHRAVLLEKKRDSENVDRTVPSVAVSSSIPVQEAQIETRTSTGKRRIVLTTAATVEPKLVPDLKSQSSRVPLAEGSRAADTNGYTAQPPAESGHPGGTSATVTSVESKRDVAAAVGRPQNDNRTQLPQSVLSTYASVSKEKENKHLGKEQSRPGGRKVMLSQTAPNEKRRAVKRTFAKGDHHRSKVLFVPPSDTDSELETESVRIKRSPVSPAKHATVGSKPLSKSAGLTQILAKIEEKYGEYTFSMENHISVGLNVSVSQLLCSSGTACIWKATFQSRALAVKASNHIVAVLLEDNMISVLLTSNGKPLSHEFAVSQNVKYIDCRNWCLFVIFVTGKLCVWSFEGGMKMICRTNALPYLRESDVSVENTKLTDDGRPVVSLSNGKTFLYNSAGYAWLLLADSSSSFFKLATVRNLLDASERLGVHGPLRELTRDNGLPALVTARTEMLSTLTENFFEMQVQSSRVLQSKDEYKYWLTQYVKNLVDGGNASKLRSVLQFLDDDSTDKNVANWPKRQLLKDVLPLLCANPSMECLYTEYAGSPREISSEDLVMSVANSIADQ